MLLITVDPLGTCSESDCPLRCGEAQIPTPLCQRRTGVATHRNSQALTPGQCASTGLPQPTCGVGLGWTSRGTLGRGLLTSVSYLKICIYSHSYTQTASGNRGGTARKITCCWKEPLSQIPIVLLDSLHPASADGGQPRIFTPLSSDLQVITGKPGIRMELYPDSTPDSLLLENSVLAPAQPTTWSNPPSAHQIRDKSPPKCFT